MPSARLTYQHSVPLRKSFVFRVEGKERKKENKECMATPRGDVTDGANLGTAGNVTKVQGTILGADRILVGSGDTIELRLKFGLSTGVGVKLFNDYNDKGVYNALDTLELVDELHDLLSLLGVTRESVAEVVENHRLVVEEDRISRLVSSELRGRDHRQFKSSGFAETINAMLLDARKARKDKPEPIVDLVHVPSKVLGQVDYAG
jgi:hypothetical protein